MVKAGIKIPLADYSGAIASPLISNPIVLVPSPQTSTGAITLPVVTTPAPSTPLSEIETKHGKDIALFINKINADWKSIIDFYKLDTGARIAGYEFVSTGSSDHVFVDIVIGTGTVGIYDMKILYQYEKTAYKRKLIGMFDYIASASRYTTRPGGSNPFP